MNQKIQSMSREERMKFLEQRIYIFAHMLKDQHDVSIIDLMCAAKITESCARTWVARGRMVMKYYFHEHEEMEEINAIQSRRQREQLFQEQDRQALPGQMHLDLPGQGAGDQSSNTGRVAGLRSRLDNSDDAKGEDSRESENQNLNNRQRGR